MWFAEASGHETCWKGVCVGMLRTIDLGFISWGFSLLLNTY